MNAIPAANDHSLPSVVLAELKKGGLSPQRLAQAEVFCTVFFARVGGSDIHLHTPMQWAALVGGPLEFMQQRPAGCALVRVLNPANIHAGRSLLQIVTDDMPFLVDTVSMIVSTDAQIHAVIHPVVTVSRDGAGTITAMGGEAGGQAESVMHFEIDRAADAAEQEQLKARVEAALEDVRASVNDWAAMRNRDLAIADDLPKRSMPLDDVSVQEASQFMRWLADDNFTFLGYREYEVVDADGDRVLRPLEGSGMGILRKTDSLLAPRSVRSLAASELPQSGATDAIILTKTNARSKVHRPGYMDYVGVLEFGADGRAVAEQRFLGLYTSSSYMTRPQDVPLVRHKVEAVMVRSGLKRDSYSGKSLRHILETLPRDELLQGTEDELFNIAMGILELRQRARTRLFVRRDRYGRFFTCLVFVLRERFNTSVRERIEALLGMALHAVQSDSSVEMGESALARLTIVMRPKIGDQPVYDLAELEQGVAAIVRNWHDEVRDALVRLRGEHEGVVLANRHAKSLPAGYVEDVSPAVAAEDIYQLSQLTDEHVLRVFPEHVYEIPGDAPLSIQDFEVQPVGKLAFSVEQVGALFEDAFEQIWRGNAENDGFNRLVLGAKLGWRQVAMLRGYSKYLLQTGVTFSQSYMEETLNRYPAIAGLLVELFLARFDPRRETLSADELKVAGATLTVEMKTLMPAHVQAAQPTLIDELGAALSRPRAEQIKIVEGAIGILLENVASLDEDRILRSFVGLIRATLRTSFFQRRDGDYRPYISYKLDSHQVAELPKPVPYREIWVCSPRVEGIHLRFGAVARGGLRWSDRREDFRTEVLGL